MTLPAIEDLAVAGERVLVRADLNVPVADGVVIDDFRIRASLATIAALRARGAKVIVASHLGRPDGPDPALSMAPVSEQLGALGGFTVCPTAASMGFAPRTPAAAVLNFFSLRSLALNISVPSTQSWFLA